MIPATWDSDYSLKEGIYIPRRPVAHRDEEYDSHGFAMLARMQQDHFWYRGRHRFLLHAVRSASKGHPPEANGQAASVAQGGADRRDGLRVVDLGGGCGGWAAYLHEHLAIPMHELALADSSLAALALAADYLPACVTRYQIDLLSLLWRDRWDMAFLLDVLEHIPDDAQALCEIHRALAPGGLLFVTTPALQFFWTWNDELAHHQRRYAKADFHKLARRCGYDLVDVRYFMFFLSPLLLAARWTTSPTRRAESEEELRGRMARMHAVPSRPLNGLLSAIFAAETPLGHHVPFPWGTSVLAVLKKTANS